MQPLLRQRQPGSFGLGCSRGLQDITNLEEEFQRLACDAKPLQRPVVVTSTGFHATDRQRLMKLAQQLGATYSADLVAGTTTHLVCKRLIDAVGGPKHAAALRWGVAVVSAAWLEDSAAAGTWQPVEQYKDDPPAAWQPSPWVASACHSSAHTAAQQPHTAVTQQHPSGSGSSCNQQLLGQPEAQPSWTTAAASISTTSTSDSSLQQVTPTPFSFSQLPTAKGTSSPAQVPWQPAQAAGTPHSASGHAQFAAAGVASPSVGEFSPRGVLPQAGGAPEEDDIWVPETQVDWQHQVGQPGEAEISQLLGQPGEQFPGKVQQQAPEQHPAPSPLPVQEQVGASGTAAPPVAGPAVASSTEEGEPPPAAAWGSPAASAAKETVHDIMVAPAAAPSTTSTVPSDVAPLRRLRRRAGGLPAALHTTAAATTPAGDSDLEDSDLEDSGCSELVEGEEQEEEQEGLGQREAEEGQQEGEVDEQGQEQGAQQGSLGQHPAAAASAAQPESLGQLVTPGCSVRGSSWPSSTPPSAASTSSSLPCARLSFSGMAAGSSSSKARSSQQLGQDQQQAQQQTAQPTMSSSSSASRGSGGRSLSLSRSKGSLAATAARHQATIEVLRDQQQQQLAAKQGNPDVAAAAAAAAAGGASQGQPGVEQGSSDEEVDSAPLQQQAGSTSQGSVQPTPSAVSFITKRRCAGGRGERGAPGAAAAEGEVDTQQGPAPSAPGGDQDLGGGDSSATSRGVPGCSSSSPAQQVPAETTPPTMAASQEVTRVGTAQAAAGAQVLAAQLGTRLPHLAPAAGPEAVLPLKLLARPPRGSTAKQHHRLRSSKQLVYAEQVQVPWARSTLSTKERSRCVILQQPAPAGAPPGSKPHTTCVVEPLAFYQLGPGGEWWLEGHRFYSAKDLRGLAAVGGAEAVLPPDFHPGCELLRGLQHTHVPMSTVKGEVKLARLRKAPSERGGSKAPGALYWRYELDVVAGRVLLDKAQPSSAGGEGPTPSCASGAAGAPSTVSTAGAPGC